MPLHRVPLLVLFAVAASVHGATIKGSVVETQSGRALSRAVVSLQPVPGTPGVPRTVRSGASGVFEFRDIAAGAYVLKAAKRGFLPTEYGQKRWNSAGTPVFVTADSSPFLSLRLPRYGAITGTSLDENDIGVPQQEVVVYRNTQPPQAVGRATTDDRGVYRIPGLEPGQYLIRSAGHIEDDMQYLPTFSPQTLRIEQARPVDVYIDADTKDVDVRPMGGRLFKLTVSAEPSPLSAGPSEITLSSDLGRVRVVGNGFEFKSLPPGRYELHAEAKGPPFQAAYANLSIGGDTVHSLSMQPVRETRFEFTHELAEPQILARRRDHAGVHEAQHLKLGNLRTLLAPGRWEIMLIPPPGQYVSGFAGLGITRAERLRADGWNEVTLFGPAALRFELSSGAGAIAGVVKSSGEVVPGAPVFLEAYDPNTGRRLMDLRETRTDLRGAYRFDGVAPGLYRVLGTFEYLHPDIAAMNTANLPALRVEQQNTIQVNLDLYVIR